MSEAFRNGAWTFVAFEFMPKKHTAGDSHLALNTLTTVSANSEDIRNLCTTSTMSSNTSGLPCIWGSLTKDELKQVVNATYEEIVFGPKIFSCCLVELPENHLFEKRKG